MSLRVGVDIHQSGYSNSCARGQSQKNLSWPTPQRPPPFSARDVVSSLPVVSNKHPRSAGSVLNAEMSQPDTGLPSSPMMDSNNFVEISAGLDLHT